MKKILNVLAILLPIIAIGIYILIEKNKQNSYQSDLEQLDSGIVEILKDTSSSTYKYLKEEFNHKEVDTIETKYYESE